MKTRNLTLSGVFMALGLVMHFIVPPFFFGVKPDFLLSMMFISLMIVDDFKEALLIGIAGGLISALTTNFPGGQIPNFIEKIISTIIMFGVIKKMHYKYSIGKVIFIFALGTFISGSLFLLIALSFTDQLNLLLPTFPVVIIAMIINSMLGILLYGAYKRFKIRH